MRFFRALKWEIILQFRYKIYFAALVVTLIWAVLLAPLKTEYKTVLVPFVLFIDLAILGFYFMGAMVLFEKGQNTIRALVVTPIRISMYIFTKLLAFAVLSLATSGILTVITYGIKVNWWLLLAGVVLNSVIYTLIGFITISWYDSISDYLIPSWLYLLLTQLPLIDYFHLVPNAPWIHWILFLHPMQGPLTLIKAAFTGSFIQNILLSLFSAAVWFVIFLMLAFRAFQINILEDQTR
jgi:fluoroquinolone transport system permease protein